MRGEILSYDPFSGAGLISGKDNLRYAFVRPLQPGVTPLSPGMIVDFIPEGDQARALTRRYFDFQGRARFKPRLAGADPRAYLGSRTASAAFVVNHIPGTVHSPQGAGTASDCGPPNQGPNRADAPGAHLAC